MATPSDKLQDWIGVGRIDIAKPQLDLRAVFETFLFDYYNNGIQQELESMTDADFEMSGIPSLERMTKQIAIDMVTAVETVNTALGSLASGQAGNMRKFE